MERGAKTYLTGLVVAAGLVLTGCATTDYAGVGGGAAPAASAFDHPRSDAAPAAPFGFQLASVEGWSGRLSYEDNGGGARVVLDYAVDGGPAGQADLEIAMPYLDGGVRRFHGMTASGEPVELQLQAGPCERAPGEGHTHFAALRVGDTAMAGCARERAREDRWSNYLMDYLPAIDACLAEFRGAPAHVSVAYTMRGGATGVRIVDDAMQTWECATREAGQAVNSLRPVDAADALHGEGDPIFVRGDFPEFGEGCYVYESVREADGTLIGALGYDACNAAPAASVTAVREPGMG